MRMKKETKIAWLVSLIIVPVLVLYELGRFEMPWENFFDNQLNEAGMVFTTHTIRNCVSKFPSGTSVGSAQFEQYVDKSVAGELRALGITRVVIWGGRVYVVFSGQTDKSVGGVTVRLNNNVSFVYQDAGGVIHITDLQGVQVSQGNILGWMDVRRVRLSTDATTGNTTLVVTVRVVFVNKDKTVVLGPDGKPVK